MSIALPEVLYLGLAVLPLLAFILIRAYRFRKVDLETLLGSWRSGRFLQIYRKKSLISGLSLVTGLGCFFLALSGVSWGNVPVEDPRTGLDLALVLDVSRSMDAKDVVPSRLKKSLEVFKALLANLPGARFSLTVYKGSAQVLSPLTQDTQLLENLLDSITTEMVSSPGSRIDYGLQSGFSTFNFPSPRYKILILASDGENWEGLPLRIAQSEALQDRRIITLGVGTAEGAPVPIAGGNLQENGHEVETRLQADLLQSLAKAGRGEYFNLSEPGVFNRIRTLLIETSGNSGGVRLETVNRYQVLILAGLFFILISMAVRIFRWKKIF